MNLLVALLVCTASFLLAFYIRDQKTQFGKRSVMLGEIASRANHSNIFHRVPVFGIQTVQRRTSTIVFACHIFSGVIQFCKTARARFRNVRHQVFVQSVVKGKSAFAAAPTRTIEQVFYSVCRNSKTLNVPFFNNFFASFGFLPVSRRLFTFFGFDRVTEVSLRNGFSLIFVISFPFSCLLRMFSVVLSNAGSVFFEIVSSISTRVLARFFSIFLAPFFFARSLFFDGKNFRVFLSFRQFVHGTEYYMTANCKKGRR